MRHVRLKRLYGGLVRPGDLVFDIGAHVGNHTRAFLALGTRVVAIEPQPRFVWFLGQIFGRHPDVTILETAIGARSGRAELRISSLHPTVSTLNGDWQNQVNRSDSFRNVRWDEQVGVSVSTLDEIIAALGRPALIKLDIEGSEHEALIGLSAPVRTLCFEALPAAPEAAQACLDRLIELGYDRFNWTPAERASLQPEWVGPDAARIMLAGLSQEPRECNLFARIDGV